MNKVKLSSLLDIRRGQSLSGDYYSESGQLKRLTLGNFDYPSGGFKENTAKKDIYFVGDIGPEFILSEGDIITPLTEQVAGLLGETATIPCSNVYIQSGDIGLVVPNESNADKRFLAYLISSPIVKKQLAAGAQQTKIRHTSPEAIKDCTVWIPETVAEQNRISTLLDLINSEIKLNSSIRSDLEAAAKLLYDYWFVQFDFPDENGRPYKSSGGKMVWNDELKREIPEGWACKRLDEIASLINNQINPSSDTDYLHFSIPAFDEGRTPSLENGDGIESNKFSLPGKCILVSKLNPQFQRVWLVIDERANKISSTEFLPFVPKKTCSYELLYEILRSDAFYAYMCNCSSSSTGSRKRMPPELCLEYKIAFPKEDSDLLERFQTATASTLSYLAKIPGESKRLAELRVFLLPLLMNGQVTIEDDGK